MASYNIENDDNIGGGGWGGLGFGGGSWGFIILLFLFFAIFSGGGNLFSRHETREEPKNWQIERDVLESRYSNANLTAAGTAEIIANQNAIDQRRADRELVDAKNQIAQMQTVAALSARAQVTDNEVAWIKNHMAEKPPVWAAGYMPAGLGYPTRGADVIYQ